MYSFACKLTATVQSLPPTPLSTGLKTDDDATDSDDDALLDGADDFMAQFREQRIAQMSQGPSSSSSSSASGSTIQMPLNTKPLPYFGEVICVDDFDPRAPLLSDDGKPVAAVGSRGEYVLFHLSSLDPRVTTIVHAYEPDIKVAEQTNSDRSVLCQLI